jgi:hypothetical protein
MNQCFDSTALQTVPQNSSSLQDIVQQQFEHVSQQPHSNSSSSSSTAGPGAPVCISSSGINILPARTAAAPAPVQLLRSSSSSGDRSAAAAAAEEAAKRAAALNADAGNASSYSMAGVSVAQQVLAPQISTCVCWCVGPVTWFHYNL